jgi:hypothetical protein
MASNAPKDTTATADETPADATLSAGGGGTPLPDALTPETQGVATPGGTALAASVVGNLITLEGTGFESKQRYDVRFQRPDGSIDNTIAVANEYGSLATYATVKGQGKHEAWLEVLGKRIAGLKFKV